MNPHPYATFVALQIALLLGLSVSAAATLSPFVFLVSVTTAVFTSLVRIAFFPQRDWPNAATRVVATWIWPGLGFGCAIMSIVSVFYPGISGLVTATFVVFVASLVVGAACRTARDVATPPSVATWIVVAVRGWEFVMILAMSSLGVANVATGATDTRKAIIGLIGMLPLASMLDHDQESASSK